MHVMIITKETWENEIHVGLLIFVISYQSINRLKVKVLKEIWYIVVE